MKNDILDTNTLFARVSDGKITEYPVSGLHIRNRAHPKAWYKPVVQPQRPVITEFQHIRETPVVTDDHVTLTYEVKDFTLDNILRNLLPAGSTGIDNTIRADVNTLTVAQVERISELASEMVQDMLDTFAEEKGYDDIKSAITYLNSGVVSFAADAAIALTLRDQTWDGLYTYLASVQADTTDVPLNTTEIKATLPTLVW